MKRKEKKWEKDVFGSWYHISHSGQYFIFIHWFQSFDMSWARTYKEGSFYATSSSSFLSSVIFYRTRASIYLHRASKCNCCYHKISQNILNVVSKKENNFAWNQHTLRAQASNVAAQVCYLMQISKRNHAKYIQSQIFIKNRNILLSTKINTQRKFGTKKKGKCERKIHSKMNFLVSKLT